MPPHRGAGGCPKTRSRPSESLDLSSGTSCSPSCRVHGQTFWLGDCPYIEPGRRFDRTTTIDVPAASMRCRGHHISQIVERVKAGLRRARAQGKTLGRPRVAPEVERQIRAGLSKGRGIRAVAQAVGVGTGTVQRVKAETRRAKTWGPSPVHSGIAPTSILTIDA